MVEIARTELPKGEIASRDLVRFLLQALAHDVKSPLRQLETLLGWTADELEAGDVEKVRQRLGIMQERVARMRRLIDDLMDYARADRVDGEVETLAPSEVIEALARRLNAPGFVFDISPSMAPVSAPRLPFETVFTHLLFNAVVHHDAGSGRVAVRAETEAARVVFVVEDDGPGIAAHLRAAAFEPLRTLRPRAPGSGIGLALAGKIVGRYGGRIWIEDAPTGRGTVVRVSWPTGALSRDAS